MGVAKNNLIFGRFESAVVHDPGPDGASIDELLAFERMLADLSARFSDVPAEQVEFEIHIAQLMLREFLGFDRSTFAEFRDDGALVGSVLDRRRRH